jgi:endonuclease-3
VGEKTAKVILHVLFGHPVIAVDTHVHRVCNRIGLVKTDTPLQTSRLIADRIPKKYRSIAHHSLIFFGRYHCKAINPLCDTCPFCSFCFYYKEIKKNIRK